MVKIIVKEIEIYFNNDNSKSVSEYLIYVKNGDVNINAFIEFGDLAKLDRINELIFEFFPLDEPLNKNNIILETKYKHGKN
jgi:hypothetical protein